MRSGLTESRPASDVNTYRSWPNSDPRPPLTPKPLAQVHGQFSLVPAEGWLPLLLLTVAVYSVVYAVTAAITINHDGVLWITTALGLLSGLIVSKSRVFPQAIQHIGVCIVGYWLALFLTSTLAYQTSVLELISSLRTFIASGFALPKSQESDMVFLFYLSFLCFFLGYFGSWLVYRAHLPWLVALVYVSIMLVNLNYISKLDLSFLIVILVGSLILLIAHVQLANRLSQWKSDGLYTDQVWLRNLRGRFLGITSLFVLLILPFSWLLPIVSQPSAGVAFWNDLSNASANLTHGRLPSFNNLGNLFSPYDSSNDFFGDQLSITGSVNLPNGPVLSYSSSDSRMHYLEGFTYDNFDGHTWTSKVANASQSYNANEQLPFDNSQSNLSLLTTTVMIIQPPNGTKSFIFAPAEPVSFNVPVTLFTDSSGKFISSWTQTGPLSQGEPYTVNSEVLTAPSSDSMTSLLLQNSAKVRSELSDFNQYYLQTPTDLSSEVQATAHEWTTDANNDYSVVVDLQNHLSDPTNFTYSLTNDPVPSDMDAVTWLLHTHKGFCTYYATAMVIMARLLGIPARMVNGFSQGQYNERQKVWTVSGSDAHSWVQVYFSGYGWIDFDPTPGFSLTNTTKPITSPVPSATQTRTSSPTVTPNKSPTVLPATPVTGHSVRSGSLISANSISGTNLLIDFSLIVLLGSCIVLGFALVRYRSYRSPVSRVYARLCRVASLFGSPPAAWQTPYEYTFALSKRFPQAAPILRRLADLFVHECWASPRHAPTFLAPGEVERLWQNLRNTILRSPFSKKR